MLSSLRVSTASAPLSLSGFAVALLHLRGKVKVVGKATCENAVAGRPRGQLMRAAVHARAEPTRACRKMRLRAASRERSGSHSAGGQGKTVPRSSAVPPSVLMSALTSVRLCFGRSERDRYRNVHPQERPRSLLPMCVCVCVCLCMSHCLPVPPPSSSLQSSSSLSPSASSSLALTLAPLTCLYMQYVFIAYHTN